MLRLNEYQQAMLDWQLNQMVDELTTIDQVRHHQYWVDGTEGLVITRDDGIAMTWHGELVSAPHLVLDQEAIGLRRWLRQWHLPVEWRQLDLATPGAYLVLLAKLNRFGMRHPEWPLWLAERHDNQGIGFVVGHHDRTLFTIEPDNTMVYQDTTGLSASDGWYVGRLLEMSSQVLSRRQRAWELTRAKGGQS